QSLDAGFQMPNARIRPHLTITMDYSTLERLALATGSSARTDAGDSGDQGVPVISTSLDYDQLIGVAPATLADGTPIPPGVLARLACESMLTRVVFGPDSTILDAGR